MQKNRRKNFGLPVKVIVGRKSRRHVAANLGNIMTLKSTALIVAAAMLGAATSLAIAQTADQHNAPGGPKDKVEKFVNQYGLTLPPPPPTPPSAPVSTTTVTSPPAAPPKKK